MDERTRRRLDAIAAARKLLDDEEEQLITRALAEMHRRAGVTAKDEALIKTLTPREQSHTVNSSMMTAVHKVAISAGRKKKDAFLQAIRAKGYTLRGLATALDIPPSLISMYRGGDRPIPSDRADRIEALTGWKATRGNWPGGIV